MVNYCIPSDFNISSILYLKSLNLKHKDKKIYETYGCLNPSAFGSARNSYFLPEINIYKLKEYVLELQKHNINFNYTLNNISCGGIESSKAGRKKIFDFLENLFDIGINQFTIANPYILDFIRTHFPKIEIILSTVMQIDSANQLMLIDKLGVSRVVLYEDQNRNFALIEELVKRGFEVELLVNAMCLYNCPYRAYHYTCDYNHKVPQEWFKKCIKHILTDPVEIFKSKGWIRPEDISYYKKIGVSYFKIIGREFCKDNHANGIIKTTEAYLSESYDGNLLDLLTNFSSNIYFSHISIDNKRINNFNDYFKNRSGLSKYCSDGCYNCKHCHSFAEDHLNINQEINQDLLNQLHSSIEETLSF